jgi:hypothetical protein
MNNRRRVPTTIRLQKKPDRLLDHDRLEFRAETRESRRRRRRERRGTSEVLRGEYRTVLLSFVGHEARRRSCRS